MPRDPAASRHRSPLIGGQWREDRSKVHFNSMADVNPRKDHSHSPSRRPPRPLYKEQPMDGQRLARIQRENRLLEKRIEVIYSGKTPSLDNKNYFYDMNRINHLSIFRERQYTRTQKENVLLEKRLWDIKPFIRTDDWAKSYRNHERHAKLRTGGCQVSPRASRKSIYSETSGTTKETPRGTKEEKSPRETDDEKSDDDTAKEKSRRRKKDADVEAEVSHC